MLGERDLSAEFLQGLYDLVEHARVSRTELRARERHDIWNLRKLVAATRDLALNRHCVNSWDTIHTGLDAPCGGFPLEDSQGADVQW